MSILEDMIGFIKTLTFMDIVFFSAVVVLMLLVIILIYFFKENENIEIDDINNNDNLKDDFDLKKVTEALENASPSTIDLNSYEEDQEEKAIISYDELLKHKTDFALNYSEEENVDDDLTIKKVDLDNLVNKDIIEMPNLNVQIISYEKEEAFLKALKQLQELIN